MFKRIRITALSSAAVLYSMTLAFAAKAQTASDIIPAASGTNIVTNVVTSGWETFAAIIGIVAGVVIIIGLIWMGIRKVFGAMTGHGRM